jgi:hypothetical protein
MIRLNHITEGGRGFLRGLSTVSTDSFLTNVTTNAIASLPIALN